jgi:hypothetical protein
VPRALESLILSCLEKNPANRPRTAYELADKLASLPFDQPWSRELARIWWNEHMPSTEQNVAVAPDTDLSETISMTDDPTMKRSGSKEQE